MEVREAISQRRSIRAYLPETPSGEQLETLMDAAFDAPSGGNDQNWHFSVITDRELLAELEMKGAEAVKQYGPVRYREMLAGGSFRVLHGAPCLILAAYDPELPNGEVDCAMAAENICLTAVSMGMGTCLIGLINFLLRQEGSEAMRERCGIPSGYECAFGVTLGFPARTPKARPRDRTKVRYIP